MPISETGKMICRKFTEWCLGYMRDEDVDGDGITVFVHPVYKFALLACKGAGQQKERLNSVFALCNTDGEYALEQLDDTVMDGVYIGTALLRYCGGKRSLSDRFISAFNTFHRPDDPLVRTLEESFVIAKLLEYKVNPNNSISFPNILPEDSADMRLLPPALATLVQWLRRIAAGGSSAASLSVSGAELTISVNSADDFAKEIVSVSKDTQELWLKRPKRPEEFIKQIENAAAEETVDVPEDISDIAAILEMGRREGESYFRENRKAREEAVFDPIDHIEIQPEEEEGGERGDPANNRYGMDPFRTMNVNEIFFHSTVIP